MGFVAICFPSGRTAGHHGGGRTAGHRRGGRSAGRALPPVILEAAESLGDAVHGLTEGNGYFFVLAAVLVLPRGDEQQLT